ncbi:MAG: hypothetical protein ABW095_13895 [Candidatus Thiodiazotropha sp.]
MTEQVGEAVAPLIETGIAEVFDMAVPVETTQRQLVASPALCMTDHGLMGDVDTASVGQTVQSLPGILPDFRDPVF